MPKLSQTEIDAFLAERNHLARIATVRADGTPTVVPVWFIYEHGHVLITPVAYSMFDDLEARWHRLRARKSTLRLVEPEIEASRQAVD